MSTTENLYNERYLNGYRSSLSGYEFARWSALLHFVKKFVNYNVEEVLDYGSGNGLYTSLWKDLFKKSHICFADISSIALRQLITSYPEFKDNTQLIIKNKTEFTDKSFDVVLSVEVMEHVEDLDAYLNEIFRILKPNGRFIWTTPCANKYSIEHIYSYRNKLIEQTNEGFRRWKWEDPTHLRRLKSKEIKNLLINKGYKKVKFRYRAHFFSFLCTKLWNKGIISEKLSLKLMVIDYKLFRLFPNGASMIGCALK